MQQDFLIKFEGQMAEAHRLPAYDASKSFYGISRALLIAMNYLDEGKVRLACTRFRRHRVRCFDGTGGASWSDGSFIREFKLEAVRLIKERGVSYVQAAEDLGVHQSQLRTWVKAFADDPQQAFPGQGQMKPEQLEIAQLRREVAKLKAERDILNKAAAYFAKEST